MASRLPAEYGPPFSVTAASMVWLERSLEQAVRVHADAMESLRLAVEACVADLHDRGMSPEATLVTMKELVRHTARAHPPPGHAPSPHAAETLMEDIVRWMIVAYYERHPDA